MGAGAIVMQVVRSVIGKHNGFARAQTVAVTRAATVAEDHALVLGVDHLLDMGRSATNVIGNSLATAVVAKWEGQLVPDAETDDMIEGMEVLPA